MSEPFKIYCYRYGRIDEKEVVKETEHFFMTAPQGPLKRPMRIHKHTYDADCHRNRQMAINNGINKEIKRISSLKNQLIVAEAILARLKQEAP